MSMPQGVGRPASATAMIGSKRARTIALAAATGNDRAAAACVRMFGPECVYRLGVGSDGMVCCEDDDDVG